MEVKVETRAKGAMDSSGSNFRRFIMGRGRASDQSWLRTLYQLLPLALSLLLLAVPAFRDVVFHMVSFASETPSNAKTKADSRSPMAFTVLLLVVLLELVTSRGLMRFGGFRSIFSGICNPFWLAVELDSTPKLSESKAAVSSQTLIVIVRHSTTRRQNYSLIGSYVAQDLALSACAGSDPTVIFGGQNPLDVMNFGYTSVRLPVAFAIFASLEGDCFSILGNILRRGHGEYQADEPGSGILRTVQLDELIVSFDDISPISSICPEVTGFDHTIDRALYYYISFSSSLGLDADRTGSVKAALNQFGSHKEASILSLTGLTVYFADNAFLFIARPGYLALIRSCYS
ncbi:unnamed protein product [Dibothriocephalus latus]|uniref:Uncharacterized protein n=1 Tax=Dibothriocephalus latus TaxID=60516 RepID=A0A3P7LTI4_DIBLA|nr:unnamed protein product [Dibothriocephalus latus]